MTKLQAAYTHESVIQALDHLDQSNAPGRHADARALLVLAPALPQPDHAAAYAARADTEGEPTWKSKAITLSAIQLAEALEFAAPDFDNDEDQRETEVCIAWAPENTVSNDEGGFEAPGYVVWLEEYPEEGCMPLDGGNPRPLVSIENERRRKSAAPAVTNEMVSRFLSWPMPQDFGPDCHIVFDKAKAQQGSWPVGTNLFHAGQVRDMLQHVLGG